MKWTPKKKEDETFVEFVGKVATTENDVRLSHDI